MLSKIFDFIYFLNGWTTFKITSFDLVNAHINRCKAVDPFVHAIIHKNFEAALEEARQVDEFLATTTEEYRINEVILQIKFNNLRAKFENFCEYFFQKKNPRKCKMILNLFFLFVVLVAKSKTIAWSAIFMQRQSPCERNSLHSGRSKTNCFGLDER